MPDKTRNKWQRPFNWPPETWEFTPGMQKASEIVLAILFLLLIATVICAIIVWPVLIYRTLQNVSFGTSDDVRNTMLAVGALIGVPFLIWRTTIAARQTNISREAHYTGLFTKAVEQLGSEKTVKRREFRPSFQRDDDGEVRRDKDGNPIPQTSATGEAIGEYSSYEVTATNYEIRLGAIYALERIMQDSRRDAWPIYLTLCAYVQNNGEPRRAELKSGGHTERNNSDLSEIFNVLDRYKGERNVENSLVFERIHIPPLRLPYGNLQRAQFSDCSVGAVTVRGQSRMLMFSSCNFGGVDIRQAEVFGLTLREGKIESLTVTDASLEQCDFSKSTTARLWLLEVSAENTNISMDSEDFRIIRSDFENVRFEDRGSQPANARRLIRLSSFKKCTFVECDFSFMDLVDCKFTDCVFERCNLFRTAAGLGEGNSFVDTFDHSSFEPDEKSQFPAMQVMWAWTSWRSRHRPDDYYE